MLSCNRPTAGHRTETQAILLHGQQTINNTPKRQRHLNHKRISTRFRPAAILPVNTLCKRIPRTSGRHRCKRRAIMR